MRAAQARYFKSERSLDKISNDKFSQLNELFGSILRTNKDLGLGMTKSKDAITEEDLAKLNKYFEAQMRSKPDAQSLQYMLLFYYTGCSGRERRMTKETFAMGKDPDGRRFMYQARDECDKNHNEKDTTETNKARICEIPGELFFFLHLHHPNDQ